MLCYRSQHTAQQGYSQRDIMRTLSDTHHEINVVASRDENEQPTDSNIQNSGIVVILSATSFSAATHNL